MGQRTQLYIIDRQKGKDYPDVDGKPNPNNCPATTIVSHYHNQWGYGYRALFDALAYIFTTRNQRLKLGKADWNKRAEWCNNLFHCEDFKKKEEPQAFKPLADSLNFWREQVDRGDNNNGIVVLELSRHEHGHIESGAIACYKGTEDCKDKEQPAKITIADFILQHGEKAGEQTLSVIKSVHELYDIIEL